MLSKLWGKISGADKGKQYAEQKGVSLSRNGDYSIIYPYGFYANAPQNQLFKVLAPGVALPFTTDRPDDLEQGETMFFHPATNTRIVARNSGNLDIETTQGDGDVNIKCVNANVEASKNVEVKAVNVNIDADQTNIGVGGEPIARVGDTVAIELVDPGEAWNGAPGEGTITSGGVNTSI